MSEADNHSEVDNQDDVATEAAAPTTDAAAADADVADAPKAKPAKAKPVYKSESEEEEEEEEEDDDEEEDEDESEFDEEDDDDDDDYNDDDSEEEGAKKRGRPSGGSGSGRKGGNSKPSPSKGGSKSSRGKKGGSESEDSTGKPQDEFAGQSGEIQIDNMTLTRARQSIEKRKKTPKPEKGVVYIGHLPFGFYEDQIRRFFTQFGVVLRLRVSRNKKTGRSRGFAFIEFGDREVAKIVVETMNNYLMYGRLLKCELLEKDEVHPQTFKNAGKEFTNISFSLNEKKRHNQERDVFQTGKRAINLLSKEAKKREALAAAGVEYDFPGYSANLEESTEAI